MSRLKSTVPHSVRVGDCQCLGKPHDGEGGNLDGDWAYLRPGLTAQGGFACWAVISGNIEAGITAVSKISRALGMEYLVDGLIGWNFIGDDGKPIPLSEDLLRSGALDWEETLLPIAEAAADIYKDQAFAPFRAELAAAEAQAKAAAKAAEDQARQLRARMKKSSPDGPTGPSTSVSPVSPSTRRTRSEPSSAQPSTPGT